MALFTADQLVAHAVSPPPTQGGGTLLPMHAARKDGTPVLALLRSDLVTIRPDLERLHGRWVVVSNRGGVEEWGLAGPFGYGGLPDEWFVGWTSLPPASAAPQEEITRLRAELEQAREALKSAQGYLRNAKIDLETGCPKRTAIQTLDGGLRLVDAALSSSPGESAPTPSEADHG